MPVQEKKASGRTRRLRGQVGQVAGQGGGEQVSSTSAGSHLAELASAHEPSRREQTPRIEDYVEIIYELIRERGYAKPVDISNHLHVKPPTVTNMLERLDRDQLIIHQKYGGIRLTEQGREMAETLGQRHALIVQFLRLFEIKELSAQRVTEALEHYVDSDTLDAFGRFVRFASLNPGWWDEFRRHSRRSDQCKI